MKSFVLRIEKHPFKQMIKNLKKAVKTGIPDIRKDELTCSSAESMMKVISKARFELFGAIVEHKPRSLAEVAKILDKDQANILRDARSLEMLGLIDLVEERDGEKKRLRPVANYGQIIFDFEAKKKTKHG